MAREGRTQKQIAERYKTNLGYYNTIHSWRRAQRLLGLLAILLTLVGIWIFSKIGRETFFNAGPISSAHGTIANRCDACHESTLGNRPAITARTFTAVVKESFHQGIAFEPIDRKCEACHKQHSFHQANVVQNRSCSACHREHEGPGPMKLVANSNCIACHGDPKRMSAAAEKGLKLPESAFRRHPHPPQQVVFELPRPKNGYTRVFKSFDTDHPDFPFASIKTGDPDVLRFNHNRHFAADIPPVDGHKLDCNFCHKPDSNGHYYQRVEFAANCQPCHSLQFDSRNPELKLPHGDAQLVRAFLRSLPAQYADFARLKRGKTTDREVQSFVAAQIKQLREEFRTGDALEKAVFFTADPYKPQRQAGANVRAQFAGCAFCHEVKSGANSAPMITQPILIDRWMPQAEFDHAKHVSVKCDECHHATQSRETADILMPVKANCVTCHSSAGKVRADCITCHTFHAPPEAQPVVAEMRVRAQISLKEMVLGVR